MHSYAHMCNIYLSMLILLFSHLLLYLTREYLQSIAFQFILFSWIVWLVDLFVFGGVYFDSVHCLAVLIGSSPWVHLEIYRAFEMWLIKMGNYKWQCNFIYGSNSRMKIRPKKNCNLSQKILRRNKCLENK